MTNTAEQPGAMKTNDGQCIRCGYDLAGLPESTACPECGLAVARSRQRSELLRSADVRWLGLVKRGLKDLELAMTALFGITVVLLVLVAAHLIVLNIWGARAPKIVESIVEVTTVVVLLAATVLHMRGCLLSTLASHSDYAAPVWQRTLVRICGVLLPLSIGAAFVLRQELMMYSGPARAVIRTAVEINALGFFFALSGLLEHYERRTVAWTAERRLQHRRVRINLGILIVLLVVNAWIFWLPVVGILIGGIPVLLLGMAYVLFTTAVSRVRQEVEMEHLIGRESEPEATAGDERLEIHA